MSETPMAELQQRSVSRASMTNRPSYCQTGRRPSGETCMTVGGRCGYCGGNDSSNWMLSKPPPSIGKKPMATLARNCSGSTQSLTCGDSAPASSASRCRRSCPMEGFSRIRFIFGSRAATPSSAAAEGTPKAGGMLICRFRRTWSSAHPHGRGPMELAWPRVAQPIAEAACAAVGLGEEGLPWARRNGSGSGATLAWWVGARRRPGTEVASAAPATSATSSPSMEEAEGGAPIAVGQRALPLTTLHARNAHRASS
mmetsp:Transcript_67740/g.190953  ORF Transcript_67740/g.190953 Transcript_67740/m.190953 type:complete len:255 (-) Transcript_67740:2-766(-)